VTNEEDLAAVVRSIIDANLYMVLGTADKTGRPWVSPVYYAAEGYTELYWVSSPEARHSRNLATRPELSIVVFDSQAPIGTGQGVYMAGVADEPSAGDLERGIGVFSRSSVAHGALEWKPEDVVAPALYRLYRATVSEHFVLDPAGRPDHRTPVSL
jgi:hypothetical protein